MPLAKSGEQFWQLFSFIELIEVYYILRSTEDLKKKNLFNNKKKVSNHKDQLLYYIIFLRITPFLPNWFINISSPIINVPLVTFVIGTFIGKWFVIFTIQRQGKKQQLSNLWFFGCSRRGTTFMYIHTGRYDTQQAHKFIECTLMEFNSRTGNICLHILIADRVQKSSQTKNKMTFNQQAQTKQTIFFIAHWQYLKKARG